MNFTLNVLAKLPVFFQTFSAGVRAIRVNGTKVTTKNALHRDNVGAEGNHESSNYRKRTCLRYTCTPLTSDLSLRSQNTYVHVF